jgi:acetoacetate decarboxylase
MTEKLKLPSSCFSQPYGPAQLYGPPPYPYRDARSITAVFTASGQGIEAFLPPGVAVADPEPLVLTTVSHYPRTAFGTYNEFWIYVRVVFGGEKFLYCPLMYTDSESATAAGRELWGFPKKRADMSLVQEADQWIFRAERPAGHCLMEVTLVEENSDEPAMLKEVALPVLSLRLIPNFTGRGEPDVAQLLATNNKKSIRVNALGGLERRQGRAHVTMNPTAADPIGPFMPTKFLGGWFVNYDTDVPAPYALVHDYKKG